MYLDTRVQPFEEWAEEWLHDGEVESTNMRETGFGGDLIWHALASQCKRLSLRIRRGKKEIIT